MRRAPLVFALLCALPAGSATLTFEQALERALAARTSLPVPDESLAFLERPPGAEWPALRAEGALSNARNLDLFHENLVHSQFFSALVTADYPLFDGGVRRFRREAGRLDAAAFRERMRERERALYEETLDAVARLYLAQEQRKILENGLQRAMSLRQRAGELLRVQEISNLTAAQWEEQSTAAELQLLDLERERLEAETRLRSLTGETTSEPLEVALDLDTVPGRAPAAAEDSPVSLLARQRDVAFNEARAARRPQLMLSAFGGIAAVGSDERFSLYGLRVTMSLPMLDTAMQRREAQARLQAAEAELERAASLERMRRDEAAELLRGRSLDRRVKILEQALEIARQRAGSVARLTSAGLRSESALAEAWSDVARRESELLAARVERWRFARTRP